MLEWLRKLFASDTVIEEIEDPMKYLIVGLGNKDLGGKWKVETLGALCEVKHKGRTLVLLKPSTYMNRSGKAVNHWMVKKKIQKDNLLVIVDDLHLDLGKMRMRGKGSDGGHNGLKDIQQVLGGSNYPRLKFGIGKDFRPGQQVDFVLGKWNDEEQEKLPKLIKKASDATKSFATIGMKFTMERYNK